MNQPTIEKRFQKNIPFSSLTTLNIGGPIKYFFESKTSSDLTSAIKYAKTNNLPYLVIGGGSNLLVSDQGFDGLVIKNSETGIDKQGETITVKAGTSLQDLVDYTINQGLGGINKMIGIPGTIGGAIYGNAAAYGQAISKHLQKVECFDGKNIFWLSSKECNFDYRNSNFKNTHYLILSAVFSLPQENSQVLKAQSQEILTQRLKKYPPKIKCPGSFFKNLLVQNLPQKLLASIPNVKDYYGKVPAWYFLNQVGARGDKLNQIAIADFHGNLFKNLGGGTAQDFYNLAQKYYLKVKKTFGIDLEPEVQFINLPPFKIS